MKNKKTIIALIRHGQTDWNLERRIQGRKDIHLNENGVLQSIKTAQMLKNNTWSSIYSSPLMRAKETAEIIQSELNIKNMNIHNGLIERNYGLAEGLNKEEEINKVKTETGFIGGETETEISNRSVTEIKKIIQDNLGKKTIIISHSSVIKHFINTIFNYNVQRINNSGILIIKYRKNKLVITKINNERIKPKMKSDTNLFQVRKTNIIQDY